MAPAITELPTALVNKYEAALLEKVRLVAQSCLKICKGDSPLPDELQKLVKPAFVDRLKLGKSLKGALATIEQVAPSLAEPAIDIKKELDTVHVAAMQDEIAASVAAQLVKTKGSANLEEEAWQKVTSTVRAAGEKLDDPPTALENEQPGLFDLVKVAFAAVSAEDAEEASSAWEFLDAAVRVLPIAFAEDNFLHDVQAIKEEWALLHARAE